MSERNQQVTDASADLRFIPGSYRWCANCGHEDSHTFGDVGKYEYECGSCDCTEYDRLIAELRARIDALAVQLSQTRATAPLWPDAERSGS